LPNRFYSTLTTDVGGPPKLKIAFDRGQQRFKVAFDFIRY